MFRGLVFLTTEAGWWRFQLQFAMHMTVQSVMSGTRPYQNDLLLPGQKVIAIPLLGCKGGFENCGSVCPLQRALAIEFLTTFWPHIGCVVRSRHHDPTTAATLRWQAFFEPNHDPTTAATLRWQASFEPNLLTSIRSFLGLPNCSFSTQQRRESVSLRWTWRGLFLSHW